jgi:hypothetical protein
MIENVLSINIYLVFGVLIFMALLAIALILGGFVGLTFYRYRGREKESLDSILLQISVTRGNETKIDTMEQLIAPLTSIKKGGGWKQKLSHQPSISFEIVARKDSIRFYVWTPKKYRDMIEKQIHGGYPDAEILEVPEVNIFNETGKVAYKALQLRSENFKPIKIYREMATDPLAGLASTLSKMSEGESAIIQILLTPSDLPWQKEGRKYISDTKKQESDPEKAKFSVSGKTLEAVESKVSKPGFEVSVRIVVSSTSSEMAKVHLTNISTAFEQYSSEYNGFKGRKIKNKGAFMEDFLYRYPPMFNLSGNRPSILNSDEIATLFHLPNKQITTPAIFWLNAKTAPAPSEIPTTGLYLGVSTYRGQKRPICMSDEDRRRHIYIVGATGVGKSQLMLEMILQDIRAGKGVCFIDPHDTVRDLIKLIPPERAEDVIYFNPGDMERPMGLNLLDAKTESEQHFAATAVINMMYKLFDPYKTGIVGPRFEHGVRNAMLTVMQGMQGGTFVDVMQCMIRADFVMELLPRVTDPLVKRYWTDQIAQTSDFHKSEVLDYTVSKFGRFVTNKMIRNIIGQSQSSFDFRKVMDEGKILLIDLAKGEIGEENSNFLGLVLIPKILIAAMSRADTPEELRRDFYFYVDEFQNFATPDFAVILSEARKYRLNLCVANQFIGQMEEEVKNAIFGNVGTKIAFRVGVTDAGYLAHEFAPTFGEDDLLNIEKYNAYVKTIVHNDPMPPFSMNTSKDINEAKARENPRVAEIIKEMSRLKYGRDVATVDAEIARRAKL